MAEEYNTGGGGNGDDSDPKKSLASRVTVTPASSLQNQVQGQAPPQAQSLNDIKFKAETDGRDVVALSDWKAKQSGRKPTSSQSLGSALATALGQGAVAYTDVMSGLNNAQRLSDSLEARRQERKERQARLAKYQGIALQNDEVAYSIAAMGGTGGIDAGLYQLANMAPEEAMQYIQDAEGVQAGYNMLKGMVMSGVLTEAEAEAIAAKRQTPEEISATTRTSIDMMTRAKLKHEDEIRAKEALYTEVKEIARDYIKQGMAPLQAFQQAVEATKGLKNISIFSEYMSAAGQPTPWTLQTPYVSQNYMMGQLMPELEELGEVTKNDYMSQVTDAQTRATAKQAITNWEAGYQAQGWGVDTVNQLKNQYLQRTDVKQARGGFTTLLGFRKLLAEDGGADDAVMKEIFGGKYDQIKAVLENTPTLSSWDYDTVSGLTDDTLNSLTAIGTVEVPTSTAAAEQAIAAREANKANFDSWLGEINDAVGAGVDLFTDLEVDEEDIKSLSLGSKGWEMNSELADAVGESINRGLSNPLFSLAQKGFGMLGVSLSNPDHVKNQFGVARNLTRLQHSHAWTMLPLQVKRNVIEEQTDIEESTPHQIATKVDSVVKAQVLQSKSMATEKLLNKLSETNIDADNPEYVKADVASTFNARAWMETTTAGKFVGTTNPGGLLFGGLSDPGTSDQDDIPPGLALADMSGRIVNALSDPSELQRLFPGATTPSGIPRVGHFSMKTQGFMGGEGQYGEAMDMLFRMATTEIAYEGRTYDKTNGGMIAFIAENNQKLKRETGWWGVDGWNPDWYDEGIELAKLWSNPETKGVIKLMAKGDTWQEAFDPESGELNSAATVSTDSRANLKKIMQSPEGMITDVLWGEADTINSSDNAQRAALSDNLATYNNLTTTYYNSTQEGGVLNDQINLLEQQKNQEHKYTILKQSTNTGISSLVGSPHLLHGYTRDMKERVPRHNFDEGAENPPLTGYSAIEKLLPGADEKEIKRVSNEWHNAQDGGPDEMWNWMMESYLPAYIKAAGGKNLYGDGVLDGTELAQMYVSEMNSPIQPGSFQSKKDVMLDRFATINKVLGRHVGADSVNLQDMWKGYQHSDMPPEMAIALEGDRERDADSVVNPRLADKSRQTLSILSIVGPKRKGAIQYKN